MTKHNGAEVSYFRKHKALPRGCPFCNADGQVIHMDTPQGQRIFGVQCSACATMGNPGANVEEAIAAWNQRAEADPASLANADTTPEAASVGAALLELARSVYAGGLGEVSAFVTIFVIPGVVTPDGPAFPFGLSLHAIEIAEAAPLCAAASTQLKRAAAEGVSNKNPSGIIVPGS